MMNDDKFAGTKFGQPEAAREAGEAQGCALSMRNVISAAPESS